MFKTYIKPQVLIIFLLIIIPCFYLYSSSQDTKRVDILYAEFMEADENIAKDAVRLIGNVNIRHEGILMWCDSAYSYTGTNKVDAFGNVHINQGDTVNLYAEKIYYNGDISFAQAIGNVRLENKSTTLFTDILDYDLAANIAYYNNFGKIIDSTNVLTSIIGKYFIDDDMAHFYKEVEGYNEKYTLISDTLHYNTETGIFFIEGPTTIRDSSSTLYAEDGWYDTNTGEAELLKKPVVSNEKQEIRANFIKYNDEESYTNAKGAVQIEDFENHILVTGENATYSETLDIATVTDSAVLMIFSATDTDTLFLHADTLRTVPDTVESKRIVMAFYGTRFFRSDMQGVCDSLVYFTKDSLIQLHYLPIVWSDIHQMSADYMEMQQFSDAPDEMRLVNNSFVISQQAPNRFDQIKGKNITGYIIENELNNIEIDGNGETLYYLREKEDEIVGPNLAESDNISIQLREGRVYRIAFLKPTQGTLKPFHQINAADKTLSGFDWKIDLRPTSKYDIFSRSTTQNRMPVRENIQENTPGYTEDEIEEDGEMEEANEAEEEEETGQSTEDKYEL